MNGADRIERELSSWFADTAVPQTPDWTADILAVTATMRQRPRWSFPTRWLPAAVVPRLPRRSLGQPVPWRTFAILAVLGLLLAAAVALYVGSRPRLPAPFGPAENGLVAYSELGEIWTVDPLTGERKKIVTLTGRNEAPRFSRDGTRVAFLTRAGGELKLAITSTDGSGLVESKGESFVQPDTDAIVWSPDGRFVAVVANAGRAMVLGGAARRTIYLVDTTSGEVRDLDTPRVDVEPYWRPPDGRQLMYAAVTGAEHRGLFIVDLKKPGADAVSVSEPGLRPGGWTPNGEQFVVHHWGIEGPPWTSLLDPETGTDVSLPIAFGRVSNDGTRIVGYEDFTGEPVLCVMSLSGGDCTPVASGDRVPDWEHTAGLQWSPDDRWVVVLPQEGRLGWLLLDPEGGPPITPVWSEHGVESWQRVAP